MEDLILISNLNDFIYCPASIYFHGLYGNADKLTYQSEYQINGTKAHENVDAGKYSTRKNIITALEVFSQEYGLVGKDGIFLYIQQYYRFFMKMKSVEDMPTFLYE